MVTELRPFTDQYGMIGHKHERFGLEFGDSSQRTFSYFIYLHLASPPKVDFLVEARKIEKILSKIIFTVPVGTDIHFEQETQFRRHWNNYYWWGEPWSMSRDQMIPLWICCILYSEQSSELGSYVRKIEKILSARCGLCWNYFPIWRTPHDEPKLPDLFNPMFRWSMALRAKPKRYYIGETLCDLELIFSALIISGRSWWEPSNTGDDLNFQLHLMFALTRYWSPTAWVAKQIYRLRRKPIGFKKDFTALAVQKSYFNNNNAPPMYLAAEPALKLFFN